MRTSTAFVNGLKSGSDDAWERFVEVYLPIVRSMCRDSIRDENDVDEIVSAVTLKMLTHIRSFHRTEKGRLRNYVRKATWSQIQEFYRRKKESEGLVMVEKPLFDQKYSDRFLRSIIDQVRRKRRFTKKTWRIFELYVSEVRDYQAIAELVDEKPDTVSKSIRRILAAVNDELAANGVVLDSSVSGVPG